jgi:hypothetical protein
MWFLQLANNQRQGVNMKNFKSVMVLFVACLLAASACASVMEQMKDAYTPQKIGSSTPLFVTMVGSSGSTSTATVLIPMPSIALATRSYMLLATNSVTLLKNVASFTDRDLIYFQGRSKFYWSQSSNPVATAATMQASANSAESGDLVGPFRLMTTCDFAFTADVTAGPCTLTYTLGREQ